jgi:hypothetical protein
MKGELQRVVTKTGRGSEENKRVRVGREGS